MPCSFCGKEKVAAKGLCANCYYRQRNSGTLEYKRIGKSTAACSVDGCASPHVAKGFCEKHYRLTLRYQEPVSPFGYGERRKHPLYEVWRYQSRVKEGRVSEWDDFWKFVEDVGEKPSERHAARRYRVRESWGPTNFYWYEAASLGLEKNAQMREWTSRNKDKVKHYDLKKNFGISLEQYGEMHEAQCGQCAICSCQGTAFGGDNGKSTTLAVDHDHETGAIRQLLCSRCNQGLGYFKDSVDLLEKASAYLRKHSS